MKKGFMNHEIMKPLLFLVEMKGIFTTPPVKNVTFGKKRDSRFDSNSLRFDVCKSFVLKLTAVVK